MKVAFLIECVLVCGVYGRSKQGKGVQTGSKQPQRHSKLITKQANKIRVWSKIASWFFFRNPLKKIGSGDAPEFKLLENNYHSDESPDFTPFYENECQKGSYVSFDDLNYPDEDILKENKSSGQLSQVSMLLSIPKRNRSDKKNKESCYKQVNDLTQVEKQIVTRIGKLSSTKKMANEPGPNDIVKFFGEMDVDEKEASECNLCRERARNDNIPGYLTEYFQKCIGEVQTICGKEMKCFACGLPLVLKYCRIPYINIQEALFHEECSFLCISALNGVGMRPLDNILKFYINIIPTLIKPIILRRDKDAYSRALDELKKLSIDVFRKIVYIGGHQMNRLDWLLLNCQLIFSGLNEHTDIIMEYLETRENGPLVSYENLLYGKLYERYGAAVKIIRKAYFNKTKLADQFSYLRIVVERRATEVDHKNFVLYDTFLRSFFRVQNKSGEIIQNADERQLYELFKINGQEKFYKELIQRTSEQVLCELSK
ncbi:hypothetical protein ENBRE01_0161 [Enteropsectra breve]|nr:hypothetical protein ENBRE01_0161 [Enteropsectra breve]